MFTIGDFPNHVENIPVLPPVDGVASHAHNLLDPEAFQSQKAVLWPYKMAQEDARSGQSARVLLALDQTVRILNTDMMISTNMKDAASVILRHYYGDFIKWKPEYNKQVRDVMKSCIGPTGVIVSGRNIWDQIKTPPEAVQYLRHYTDPELRLKLAALRCNTVDNRPNTDNLFRKFGLISKPEAHVVYQAIQELIRGLPVPASLNNRPPLYCLLRAAGELVTPSMLTRPPAGAVHVDWNKTGIRVTSNVGVEGIDALVRRALLLTLWHLATPDGSNVRLVKNRSFMLTGSYCDELSGI